MTPQISLYISEFNSNQRLANLPEFKPDGVKSMENTLAEIRFRMAAIKRNWDVSGYSDPESLKKKIERIDITESEVLIELLEDSDTKELAKEWLNRNELLLRAYKQIANYIPPNGPTTTYRCEHCNSSDVDVMAWQGVNTGEHNGYVDEHEAKTYCNSCETHSTVNRLIEL